MKINRNDRCPCDSGKKYKSCCGIDNLNNSIKNRYIRWIVSGIISVSFILIVWGLVSYYNDEHPDMEAYKCDNPRCNQIHYRPVTNSN